MPFTAKISKAGAVLLMSGASSLLGEFQPAWKGSTNIESIARGKRSAKIDAVKLRAQKLSVNRRTFSSVPSHRRNARFPNASNNAAMTKLIVGMVLMLGHQHAKQERPKRCGVRKSLVSQEPT